MLAWEIYVVTSVITGNSVFALLCNIFRNLTCASCWVDTARSDSNGVEGYSIGLGRVSGYDKK